MCTDRDRTSEDEKQREGGREAAQLGQRDEYWRMGVRGPQPEQRGL